MFQNRYNTFLLLKNYLITIFYNSSWIPLVWYPTILMDEKTDGSPQIVTVKWQATQGTELTTLALLLNFGNCWGSLDGRKLGSRFVAVCFLYHNINFMSSGSLVGSRLYSQYVDNAFTILQKYFLEEYNRICYLCLRQDENFYH